MAKIGFLSHADISIYHFRAPIMRALKAKGHEVFAICPKGNFSDRLNKEFKVVHYELDKASLNPFIVLKNTQNLSKILKKLDLDLLQTSAHKSNVFGTFAAKKAGIKHIINLVEGLGSFYIDYDFKSKIVRFFLENLYKVSFSQSSACIFVNDSDPAYFQSKGLINNGKICKIKSVGIDTKKFNPDYINSANISDKKVVLMIARAIWHKGLKEFYDAADILKDRRDCEFVFVGEGFDGNKSSVKMSFLQGSNVRYLGARDDIAELLKNAYMLVLPSYKEGYPRTVMEAMSMAKPVVVSNVSGCNEAVKDGFNGLLCEVKNAKDLATKIENLLNDENLALNLGKNGREFAINELDNDIVIEKYLKFYGNFINV